MLSFKTCVLYSVSMNFMVCVCGLGNSLLNRYTYTVLHAPSLIEVNIKLGGIRIMKNY